MLRRILLFLVVILALGGVLIASQLWPTPPKVSGFIEADEIRIGSRVGGRIAEVLVDEGAEVKQGQTLVRLEPYDLLQVEQEAVSSVTACQATLQKLTSGLRKEEILQTKARYEQFAARLELLKNGPRQEDIDAARGRKQSADAELALAKQNYERSSKLVREKALARLDFDRDEQKLESARSVVVVRTNELKLLETGTRPEEIAEAKAKLDEAKAAWELAKAGYRDEEIAEAKAACDAAEANLSAIRERLKELDIRSPISGVVEALELQPGDLVAPGAPVLSLMDTSHLWVRAYVPENNLDLHIGQPLPLSVDSYPDERFHGELSFIARQAEFTPSNVQTPEERSKQVFRIKVRIVEGLDRLRPGMAADVWLDAEPE